MDTKIILLALAACVLSMNAFASIAPPTLAINDETKECQVFYLGDECVSCSLPEGWTYIGDPYDTNCPSGYSKLAEQSVRPICSALKTQFCCTINHSGAGGDCEDLVVNDAEKKCVFVEDIAECDALPSGWERAPIDEFWGRACSYGYEWLPSVEYPNDLVDEFLECEKTGGNGGNGNGGQGNEMFLYAGLLLIIIIAVIAFKKFRR